jgi:hypothetical protein
MEMPSLLELLPSLRSDGKTVSCSVDDFLKLVPAVFTLVPVDEAWYLRQYPEIRESIEKGLIASALEHYRKHGVLEGRLPHEPIVDEKWYVWKYPDVAKSIQSGNLKSAFEHYVRFGCREGRSPRP